MSNELRTDPRIGVIITDQTFFVVNAQVRVRIITSATQFRAITVPASRKERGDIVLQTVLEFQRRQAALGITTVQETDTIAHLLFDNVIGRSYAKAVNWYAGYTGKSANQLLKRNPDYVGDLIKK